MNACDKADARKFPGIFTIDVGACATMAANPSIRSGAASSRPGRFAEPGFSNANRWVSWSCPSA